MDEYPIQEYYPTDGVWSDHRIADVVNFYTNDIQVEKKSFPASSFCFREDNSIDLDSYDFSDQTVYWTHGRAAYKVLSPDDFLKPTGFVNDADLLLTNFRMTFIINDVPYSILRMCAAQQSASSNPWTASFNVKYIERCPLINVSAFLFKGVFPNVHVGSTVEEFIKNGCELLTSVHSKDQVIQLHMPSISMYKNENLFILYEYLFDQRLASDRTSQYFNYNCKQIQVQRITEGNAVIIEQMPYQDVSENTE